MTSASASIGRSGIFDQSRRVILGVLTAGGDGTHAPDRAASYAWRHATQFAVPESRSAPSTVRNAHE
jgi:hypothetical protein